MLAARAGAVPVIDDSGLVMGLVSAHDLLARKAILTRPGRVLRPGLRHRREHGEVAAPTASRLMISRPAKIWADAATEEAARLMCRHRVTSVPVVDSRGRLIGIVSRDDILGTFTRPDQAIHHEVTVDLILH